MVSGKSLVQLEDSLWDVISDLPFEESMLPGMELINLDELLIFMHGVYLSRDKMFDPMVMLIVSFLHFKFVP